MFSGRNVVVVVVVAVGSQLESSTWASVFAGPRKGNHASDCGSHFHYAEINILLPFACQPCGKTL